MVEKYRIALDARCAQRPGDGVSSYALGLIKALRAYEGQFDFVFVVEADMPIEHIEFPAGAQLFVTKVRKNSHLTRDIWENSALPMVLTSMGVHLLHGLDYDIPLVKTPFIKVSTVHDAAAFTEHDGRPWISKFRVRLLLKGLARSADLLLTASMFSKQEIRKCLHVPTERIQVIWNGTADIFNRPCANSAAAQVATKLNGCDDYVLYYGGFRKHKNVEGLLRAYSLIKARVQSKLVLVGCIGRYMSKLDPLIQQLDLRDRLVFFGFASEEELKCLLQGCRLFVFPSLMEGFGLPLAEALACGAPVVCSNAASLPEVGGDAVCFFDPRNPQDCANQMLQVLENDQLRRRLQESGLKRAALFRWENSVRVLADAYNALLQQRFEQSPGIRSK